MHVSQQPGKALQALCLGVHSMPWLWSVVSCACTACLVWLLSAGRKVTVPVQICAQICAAYSSALASVVVLWVLGRNG